MKLLEFGEKRQIFQMFLNWIEVVFIALATFNFFQFTSSFYRLISIWANVSVLRLIKFTRWRILTCKPQPEIRLFSNLEKSRPRWEVLCTILPVRCWVLFFDFDLFDFFVVVSFRETFAWLKKDVVKRSISAKSENYG